MHALGALTGNQAVQQVQAGLKAIYLSGWQVAADANTALQTYPDQSLYPADSVPKVVERINNAFQRADQIQHGAGKSDVHWFAPIVADAEAGFGGNLNAYELMRAMIKAGAAGVHFEDQLASAKKVCLLGCVGFFCWVCWVLFFVVGFFVVGFCYCLLGFWGFWVFWVVWFIGRMVGCVVCVCVRVFWGSLSLRVRTSTPAALTNIQRTKHTTHRARRGPAPNNHNQNNH